MGLFSNLFGIKNSGIDSKYYKNEISKKQQELIEKFGKGTELPSMPLVTNDIEPLISYQVEEFIIALYCNVPPNPKIGAGNLPVTLCLTAFNRDASRICMYTAQRITPDDGPRLVVWGVNGQFRIYDQTIEEALDPNKFLNWYFPEIVKELGFTDKVEAVLLKKRP